MLSGFYLRFGDGMDEATNARVHALTRALLARPLAGVTDLIPSYAALFVEFDPRRVREKQVRAWVDAQEVQDAVQGGAEGREVELPVQYDGEDLGEVARRTAMAEKEVVSRHAGRSYRVYAMGFTPGLPFMGPLDPALHLPRRSAPRQKVPANTVAIANAQTTVYPVASPGGWHLLGRALTRVYDPQRDPPLLLEPGDRVRFREAPAHPAPPEEAAGRELLPPEPRRPLLRVQGPGLLDLVVDAGRFLAGRYGFARSGPLDARSAGLANRLLGNPRYAALVEMNFQGALFEAVASGVVAFAGYGMQPVLNGAALPPFTSFSLRRGDRLAFPARPGGARGYLALAGGVDSGTFLGSASVDLKGKIGRPLGAGDLLGARAARAVRPGFRFTPYGRPREVATLRLLAGPQASKEALEALTRGAFTVRSADRMGVRLSGGEAPGGEVLSEGVPIGAVQVPPGGEPILLLNDRGTMGGYHKPALIHPADLPKAAQLRPGAALRFSLSR